MFQAWEALDSLKTTVVEDEDNSFPGQAPESASETYVHKEGVMALQSEPAFLSAFH